MNIKKLFLISLLGLSTATVRPMDEVVAVTGTLGSDEVQYITAIDIANAEAHDKKNAYVKAFNKAWYNNGTMVQTIATNVFPGALVGAFTGTAIGYLSGHLFDAAINQHTIKVLNSLLQEYISTKNIAAIIAITRLTAQVGSKWYWEKPLRNKIINWVIAELKAKGVEFNEELTKTIARVAAWVGTASQISA